MSNAPVPPQNLEAEESVLGAMMMNSAGVFDSLAETALKPEDFYRETHALIYRAALAMNHNGLGVDPITLVDHLDKLGVLDKVGGRQRIHELAGLVPATANVAHYANIVNEFGTLRRLITTGQRIARLGWERPGEMHELIAQAEELLTDVVTPAVSSQFTTISDAIDELQAIVKEAAETGQPKMGTRSGFPALDTLLTGFHPGQLVLIAARPSMGKSALAQNIAENVADTTGPTAILSLEMSKLEIAIRAASRAAKIDSTRLRTGQVKPEEAVRLAEAMEAVKRRPMFVEDATDTTIHKLRAEVKRLHRQRKPVLLVVDYLQLMLAQDKGREDNRQAEIASISRQLKLLARDLQVPILALSQLNRNVEARTDKRPQLSDLRDSGALEQDADVVLFVYRDEFYDPATTAVGEAELIVAKNRNGARGTVKLAFSGRTTTFKNLGQAVVEEAKAA